MSQKTPFTKERPKNTLFTDPLPYPASGVRTERGFYAFPKTEKNVASPSPPWLKKGRQPK